MITILLTILLTATVSLDAMQQEKRKSEYTDFSELSPIIVNQDATPEEPIKQLKKKFVQKKSDRCCTKKKWLGFMSLTLIISGASSALNAYGLQEINQAACPITAYPLDNGQYPKVPRKPDCEYKNYNDDHHPPSYYKGSCTCARLKGCKCLVEECKGSHEYMQGYATILYATSFGMVSLAVISAAAGFIQFLHL